MGYKDLGFKDKLIAQNSGIIFLYRGYIEGSQLIYAYISVRMDKLEAFKKAYISPEFSLSAHGEILECGYGDPTPEVMMEMERKYNIKAGTYIDLAPVVALEVNAEQQGGDDGSHG